MADNATITADRRRLNLTVIGAGPRALGALEALVAQAAEAEAQFCVAVFDGQVPPAAGPNLDPAAVEAELHNLPVRAARARLGAYLNARWQNLTAKRITTAELHHALIGAGESLRFGGSVFPRSMRGGRLLRVGAGVGGRSLSPLGARAAPHRSLLP